MNSISHWTVDKLYGFITRSHLSLFAEKGSLCTFLFHGLFHDKKEVRSGIVDPQQGITVDNFRQFVDYYKSSNFTFITPEEIAAGLNPEKKYILITFDDGYYNNLLSLPVLKEYHVPATYFISANHVVENKSFWWDVVYRERNREGIEPEDLRKEYALLKNKKHHEIDEYLLNSFGPAALRPVSDIDRPFTRDELKKFADEPLVNIGNHTLNHAILTNYTHEEIRNEIAGSQQHLVNITGKKPSMIAYPNGNYSDEIIQISKNAGLSSGVTVFPAKNYLPRGIEGDKIFALNRFTLWGNENILRQCEFFRAEIESKRIKRKFNTWNKSLCKLA